MSSNSISPSGSLSQQEWLDFLQNTLDLKKGDSAELVFERAKKVANTMAPNTRRLWRSILLAEGLAVLLPMLWLMVAQRQWSAGVVATSVALCTIALLGLCWWLRWRRQQHAWTRSRLLEEIARSALATAGWGGAPTRSALAAAPGLRVLADILGEVPNESTNPDLPALKGTYLTNRIRDQKKYFHDKAQEASLQRYRLSRYVTRALDGALVLAVFGLWLAFSGRTEWILSLAHSDFILALAGASLPLIAICMQSLSAYLELSRRTGRYALQWEFLDEAEKRFEAASSREEAEGLVHEVERVLLSEVIEWFYERDHAELFYRSQAGANLPTAPKISDVPESRWSKFLTRTLERTGLVLGVTGRIIFGRVLVVVLTSLLTTYLIFSRAPNDALRLSILRTADGRLLSKAGMLGKDGLGLWKPQKEATDRGFILIAHGLHDSGAYRVDVRAGKDAKPAAGDAGNNMVGHAETLHWMTVMQEAIHSKLTEATGGAPDICLVDWELAARPSEVNEVIDGLFARVDNQTPEPEPGTPRQDEDPLRMGADLLAIRTQAQAIGDVVAVKLSQALQMTPPLVRKDRPMHFIGHSAGGFLVVRVAVTLQRLGLLSENTRITLLDTPMPDKEDLKQLLVLPDGTASSCQVEFYKTSSFAQFVPRDQEWPNFRFHDVKPQGEHAASARKAHSYAHQWFISTVQGNVGKEEGGGFQNSPFLKPDSK